MKKGPVIVCLGAALVAGAAAAVAQERPEHPLYVVHQEFAKPSMASQYEATSKEFVAMVTRNKAAMPHFSFVGLASEDFAYTFVARIPNFGGIDGIGQDFGALAGKEGAAFADLNKRGGAATEMIRESVVSLWPELSYAPAVPRVKFEDARYFHYDVYHLIPGRESEADAIAKDFVALFKSKNVPNGYRLFKVEMGPDMPALIVEVAAKDPADYYTQGVSDRELLGEAGRALFAKAFGITRRFERRDGWLRPDLSVRPAVAPQK